MKTEKILAILFLLGFIFKAIHFPGGNLIIIASVFALMLIYFPFGFYFLSGETVKQQVVGWSIGAGFAFHMILCGVLFSLMHWPGAKFMLIIGLVTIVPLTIVMYFLRKNNTKPELVRYYNKLILRGAILTAIGLLLFVLPILGVTVLPANLPSPR